MIVKFDSWRLVFYKTKTFSSSANGGELINGILSRVTENLKDRGASKVVRNGVSVGFQSFDYPTILFKRTINSLSGGAVIVEARDGQVTVSSRMPVGLMFYVTLMIFILAAYMYLIGRQSYVPIALTGYNFLILADLGYLLMMFDSVVTSAIDAAREELESPPMSKEQREWMNDPNRCPACGAALSGVSSQCSDCGLTVV